MALDPVEDRGTEKVPPVVPKPEQKTAKEVLAENPADAEITLEHPRSKASGSFGVYVPSVHGSVETTVHFKEGLVKLPKTIEGALIRDVLVKDGFKDLTWYGHEVKGPVKIEYQPVPVKWWFAHPDARRENPINATIGVYLSNGQERSIKVVDNYFETEDVFVAEALSRQGWPIMRTEEK